MQPETPAPLERVVLATDFTKGATHAATRTAALPLSEHAQICQIHVLPSELPRKVRASTEELARRELERARSALRDALSNRARGGTEVQACVTEGVAHAEILRRAEASEAELVVIGRHGHRAVRDLFIGSAAAHVARGSRQPTLVVQGPATSAYQRPLTLGLALTVLLSSEAHKAWLRARMSR